MPLLQPVFARYATGSRNADRTRRTASLVSVARAAGSRRVSNEEIAQRFEDSSAADIERRTGIRTRPVLAEGESIVDRAVEAARKALDRADLAVGDVSAIITSTSTPPQLSPSVSCQVLHALDPNAAIAAHDVSAACSGYLYALGSAFDFCSSDREARVLVLTAEECTGYLDLEDFDTAVLFADAASATIVAGTEAAPVDAPVLSRPLLSTVTDGGRNLGHGHRGTGPIYMNGRRIYAAAVREMTRILTEACAAHGLEPRDLDLVVPHQANGRIVQAVASKAGLRPDQVVDVTATWGNTSSSSIPAALVDVLGAGLPPGTRVGLVAFGSGLTSGAALLRSPG